MTGAQKLAELKNLVNAAGKAILQRLALAAELLKDTDWLDTTFAGDEAKARDMLESDCFGDLCGALTLGELLAIHQHFPEEKDWKAVKWNLKILAAKVDEIDAANKPEKLKREVTRVNLKEHKEVCDERDHLKGVNRDLERKYDRAESENNRLKRDNRDLRERVHQLEVENAGLKGRMDEMERLLDRQLVD